MCNVKWQHGLHFIVLVIMQPHHCQLALQSLNLEAGGIAAYSL